MHLSAPALLGLATLLCAPIPSVAAAGAVGEASQPGAASQAGPRAAPVGVQSASKVDAAGFSAVAAGEASYAAGKESSFSVTLSAKEDFKVNPQFPIKFKLSDAPDGVRFPKPVLKKEDAKLGEKAATFSVPFVAERAGSYSLKGTLSLSVCNEKKCLMEKVDLALDVTVK